MAIDEVQGNRHDPGRRSSRSATNTAEVAPMRKLDRYERRAAVMRERAICTISTNSVVGTDYYEAWL